MSSLVVKKIARWLKRRNAIPITLRRYIMAKFDMLQLRKELWLDERQHNTLPQESDYTSEYPWTIGIIKEFWGGHTDYVAACRELGVKYRVLDIAVPNWLDLVRNNDYHAFLVRPSVQLTIWRDMFLERLYILERILKKMVYPTYNELWFYESKRKMYYWLEANGLPCARTWIFYDLEQAKEFACTVQLPIVYKTDLGSGASGVRIIKKRSELLKQVDRCFRRGVTTYRRHSLDREWGFIILQEYIPDAREWRIIRVDDSFFGYEKLRVGDFHSGAHKSNYGFPPIELLNFVKQVTEKFHFSSMAFDILVRDGTTFFVNELQTVFGMRFVRDVCIVDGVPGRIVFNEEKQKWEFEPGNYSRNKLCNLRVQALCKHLSHLFGKS